MTVLSPRLAHLLIHEDTSTGDLVLPDGTRVPDTRDPTEAQGVSPPISPMTKPHASPSDGDLAVPTTLPTPRPSGDRQPSTSIFSLLNDVRSSPPKASPPSIHVRPATAHTVPRQTSAVYYHVPQPHPYPPHTAYPLSYDSRASFALEQQRMASMSRPDMWRRHSSQPYEYRPATRPGPYTTPPPMPTDLAPAVGSRAPISRTTKACNACRSRKVRCDAGGVGHGEPSTCSRCRESGVACVYSGPQKKRGPCPGTVRANNNQRPRRPSHRSSVTSIATSFAATPPSDDETWSARSSYIFPQGPAWSSDTMQSEQRQSPPSKTMPVLSWPGMQPAIEVDERKPLFQDGYSMRLRESEERISLSLPPLKYSVEKRDSYYTH